MEHHDYGSSKPEANHSPQTSEDDAATLHKEQNRNAARDNTTINRTDTYETYDEGTGTVDNKNVTLLAKRDYEAHKHLWWYRTRYICRDAFAEFFGTMIMIVFGDGSVAQVLLSANPALPAGSQNKGDYQSISWGWGIGQSHNLRIFCC